MTIALEGLVGRFAENKTLARALREQQILPALRHGETVTLNFAGIIGATQSFLHALIYEPLQELKEEALDLLEFKDCSSDIKTLVEIVVSYSLDPPLSRVG